MEIILILLTFALPLLFVLLGIAACVFWIYMLIDAIKHTADDQRVMWILVILFAQAIGALIYYFVEYKKRKNPINPSTPDHKVTDHPVSETNTPQQ